MRFSDPVHNVRQFNVRTNDYVADLGAGPGAYTLALADRIGEKGKVYAIDLNHNLLLRLKNEARRKKLHHVDIIVGDLENKRGTKLKSNSLDAAIIANVLFFLDDKKAVFEEAHRILKDDGRLLVVDWRDSYGGIGPSQEHVVSEREARTLLHETGFEVVKEIEAGSHHYGMITKKK